MSSTSRTIWVEGVEYGRFSQGLPQCVCPAQPRPLRDTEGTGYIEQPRLPLLVNGLKIHLHTAGDLDLLPDIGGTHFAPE